jgi:hypothetical protein
MQYAIKCSNSEKPPCLVSGIGILDFAICLIAGIESLSYYLYRWMCIVIVQCALPCYALHCKQFSIFVFPTKI